MTSAVESVLSVYPEIGIRSAERIADALEATAEEHCTDVDTLLAESFRAENSSAAGNPVSP